MRWNRWAVAGIAAIGFGGVASVPARAGAAVDPVTTCAGSGPGSLAAVLAAARTGDTITFSIDCPASSPITLTSTLDIVDQDLTIEGPGPSEMVVSGGGAVGVLNIDYRSTVTLSGVTIEDGNQPRYDICVPQPPQGEVDCNIPSGTPGGGIYNAGHLTLSNSVVSGNSAFAGGGIFNYRSLSISDSTISGNQADNSGGGIDNDGGANSYTMTLTGVTVTGNSAQAGGGIADYGPITDSDLTDSGNTETVGADCYEIFFPASSDSTCDFTDPPAATPEVPLTPLLPAVSLMVFGGYYVVRRRVARAQG